MKDFVCCVRTVNLIQHVGEPLKGVVRMSKCFV